MDIMDQETQYITQSKINSYVKNLETFLNKILT